MSTFGPVVLSFGDSLIRQSEIDILRKPDGWLNDVILSFYFEFMERNCTPPCKDYIKFYAATISQFIKLCHEPEEIATFFGDTNPKDLLYAFWPINDSGALMQESGSHWSLLVWSRPDDAFLHFDSIRNSSNIQEACTVFHKLRLVLSPTAEFKMMTDTKTQENSFDCGLHVIANTELIFRAIKNRKEANGRWPQLTGQGAAVSTADPTGARHFRNGLIDLIGRLGASRVAKQIQLVPRHIQAPAPQRLPAPQLPLVAPAPQLPAQPVENMQRNLANMHLT